MSKTAIVLLNYNSFQDTFECVQSIVNSEAEDFEIIIVDNASKDGSMEQLRSSFSNRDYITFLSSEENLGFSGGCNIGIQYALDKGFPFVLLLNNDTEVTPGFLKELHKEAIAEDVGLVGGKTLFADGTDDIWDAGGYISKRSFRGVRRRNGDEGIDASGDVGFITCCLALVKKEVFEKVGLLPEAYFFGSEEWDFSLRAHRAGFRLRYTPNCVIYHKVGRSHDHTSMKMVYNTFRNRLLFVKRNFSLFTFIPFLHVFIWGKAWQNMLRKGQFGKIPFYEGFVMLFFIYWESITKSRVTHKDLLKFGV